MTGEQPWHLGETWVGRYLERLGHLDQWIGSGKTVTVGPGERATFMSEILGDSKTDTHEGLAVFAISRDTETY